MLHKFLAPVNEHTVPFTIACCEGLLPEYLLQALDSTVTLENNLRAGLPNKTPNRHWGSEAHLRGKQ